ncbi:site-2 protease family protein [Halobacillus yeomjeoni]|uniref:Site-2 protease family protein n=1 Tax=Halobacillus yeomjeoni TaxID=311194 RepID=A0A931HUG2_9BACI|nr:site-2 protease family protein [Halobacillus yeomjeoni]MBH0230012.1 site-2 protease family protein [Halobacillus yeomjeoni]
MKALKLNQFIHIHPLFFLLAFSAFITGAFFQFVILITIVTIHELGHFLTARRYKWRVSRIELWLFGGAVVSEEHNTRPFKEQVHVVLAGPVQHVWIFCILFLLEMWIGPHSLIGLAHLYNKVILIFNLLPIWPLDGGKLLFYAVNQFLSFRKSLYATLVCSILILSGCSLWLAVEGRWTLAALLLASFLIVENILEWRRRSFTLMRYWMYCTSSERERLPPIYMKVDDKTLVRDVLKKIRSNRCHLYVLKQSPSFYIVNEQECLRAFFDSKKADLKVRDVPEIIG